MLKTERNSGCEYGYGCNRDVRCSYAFESLTLCGVLDAVPDRHLNV